jgi:hypothetical protein
MSKFQFLANFKSKEISNLDFFYKSEQIWNLNFCSTVYVLRMEQDVHTVHTSLAFPKQLNHMSQAQLELAC